MYEKSSSPKENMRVIISPRIDQKSPNRKFCSCIFEGDWPVLQSILKKPLSFFGIEEWRNGKEMENNGQLS